MSAPTERGAHWDDAYGTRGPEGVSWFQAEPTVSLTLIEALGVSPSAAVVDVGGGASVLVDRLVDRGFVDVTVVDISDVALEAGQRRVGQRDEVRWLRRDVLAWRPERTFGLWHDRAVFHFLTQPADRELYVEALFTGLAPGSSLIMATFAEDGPEYCSGLPVNRYSADELVAVLGPRFTPVTRQREVHTTPSGADQPFTWVAGRVDG
jgi:hypothetical protein